MGPAPGSRGRGWNARDASSPRTSGCGNRPADASLERAGPVEIRPRPDGVSASRPSIGESRTAPCSFLKNERIRRASLIVQMMYYINGGPVFLKMARCLPGSIRRSASSVATIALTEELARAEVLHRQEDSGSGIGSGRSSAVRSRRFAYLERLEDRTLLAYTFSIVGNVAHGEQRRPTPIPSTSGRRAGCSSTRSTAEASRATGAAA